MSPIADQVQRDSAIDPCQSFCVSAPAGSGKTELLIQRYLSLLARVQRPEQVLAITFTRKAAAEMRERVLHALSGASLNTTCDSAHELKTRELAQQALRVDAAQNWKLLENVSRLSIRTIDGFCRSLSSQMPVTSGFGGQANPQDDVLWLYEEAVAALFQMAEGTGDTAEDLKALLRHFDNDWGRLQGLLVNMLRRRDQWRSYVGIHEEPEEAQNYLVQVVRMLVRQELEQVARLVAPYRSELLTLLQYASRQRGEDEPSDFPACEPEALPVWRSLSDMLLKKDGDWRKRVDVSMGFPPDKSGEGKERKDQLKALLAELSTIDALDTNLHAVRILPDIASGLPSWELVLHLSRLLPVLAAQLLLVFRHHGVVDHTEVSQLALQALGEDDAPTDLALRLDYQIEHILVDEYQDTSINQYELLHKLTRGWGEYNAANPGAPRTLLIVGDAMQSIYGFRDANVALFRRAAQQGFNGVMPVEVALSSNFRSQAAVVGWVNTVFGAAFPDQEDLTSGRITYSTAVPVREALGGEAVTIDAFCGDDARNAEVTHICQQIAQCVSSGESGIAVLGRHRNHLRPIGQRLRQMGIGCHTPDLDSLAASTGVSDLLNLCAALSCDADRLAWLALLRAPWAALSLSDLLVLARAVPQAKTLPVRVLLGLPDVQAQLSKRGRVCLLRMHQVMDKAYQTRDRLGLRAWVEQTWLDIGGPESLTGPLDIEDCEQFFVLLEVAESEGRGLDIAWLRKSVQDRYMSGGNADSPVQLLTIHKSKGLEFSRVFIPGLSGSSPGDRGDLLLWDEHTVGDERVFLLAANDRSQPGEPTLYNYLRQMRKEKQHQEVTRLMYVGATRAANHLHLSACILRDEKKQVWKMPSASSLLKPIWPAFEAQMNVHMLPDHTDEEALSDAPPLIRVREASLPKAEAYRPPELPADNFPDRPDNYFERSVGTVVHLALEELSQLRILPAAVSRAQETRWRAALQAAGLWGDRLNQALQDVLASVENALHPEGSGRWILSADHREAHSEWELMLNSAGVAKKIVIDRTFIDQASGVRWIVDYKNSRPADGESMDAFLLRERLHYSAQLSVYRDAVRGLADEPVQCALYYPALGYLDPLDLA